MLTDPQKFLVKLKKWLRNMTVLFEQTDDNEEIPAASGESHKQFFICSKI